MKNDKIIFRFIKKIFKYNEKPLDYGVLKFPLISLCFQIPSS